MVNHTPSNPTASSQSYQEHLAQIIAETFDDIAQLSLYQHYCKKFPLQVIERAFKAAQDTPAEQVKKSRAAIFFYFVKTYAKQSR